MFPIGLVSTSDNQKMKNSKHFRVIHSFKDRNEVEIARTDRYHWNRKKNNRNVITEKGKN